MKVCSSCGHKNNEKDKFCQNCGKEIKVIEKEEVKEGKKEEKIENKPIKQVDDSSETISLIFGILSLFTGFLPSILGMAFGSKYRKTHHEYGSGYIISLITLLIKLSVVSFMITTAIFIFGVFRFNQESIEEFFNRYEIVENDNSITINFK